MSAENVRALGAHAVALALGLALWLLGSSGGLRDLDNPGELVARMAFGLASFAFAFNGGVWLHDRISAAQGQRCQLIRRA